MIGVLFTIVLTAIVLMLPSRLEREIRGIADRIQSPLTDFPQVMERATLLLEGLGDRPNTVFKVVSASPILGLELDDPSVERWRTSLKRRIEKGCRTELICLSPHSGARESPLASFCGVLATHYLKDPNRLEELFERGRREIEAFQKEYTGNDNLRLKLGHEPAFQIIIAQDGEGTSRGILFFSSSQTLRNGIRPTGLVTEDDKLVRVLEMLFQYTSEHAREAPEDSRDPLQRQRDAELQVFHEKRSSPTYETTINAIAEGFTLTVNRDVFPPEIALAGNEFQAAISAAAQVVWKDVPEPNRWGVDVGTGTGVLALILSNYCRDVLATDVGEKELANAQENVSRLRQIRPDCRIKVEHRDLLGGVTKPASKVPLIVFNHPYYPSPSNTFNVGGTRAGVGMIRPFLEQAKPLVATGGGVVMPHSQVAGPVHDPLAVATALGFHARVLSESHHDIYGFHRIYLFSMPEPRRIGRKVSRKR